MSENTPAPFLIMSNCGFPSKQWQGKIQIAKLVTALLAHFGMLFLGFFVLYLEPPKREILSEQEQGFFIIIYITLSERTRLV